MSDTTRRVLFEGGPFHGAVRSFDESFPGGWEEGWSARVNGGAYWQVGRTEAGLILLRWKEAEDGGV